MPAMRAEMYVEAARDNADVMIELINKFMAGEAPKGRMSFTLELVCGLEPLSRNTELRKLVEQLYRDAGWEVQYHSSMQDGSSLMFTIPTALRTR